MSHRSHHTTASLESQLQQSIDSGWQELVGRLPIELEAQAKERRAWVRKRAFSSASDLLRGLLAYVLCVGSFRQLGIWAVLIGLCNISETAWRKALRRAHPWLVWLLSQLLSGPAVCHADVPEGSRVLLIDASRLREVGGSGDDWRVHLAYDLLAGHMAQVSVTDEHVAESLSHFAIRPGDITVHDMGYGYRKHFAWVLQRAGHVVGRIYPQTFPLLDEHDQPFAVAHWLRTLPEGTHSRQVRFVSGKHTFCVRLLARSLSTEAAARARAAKRKKAAKDGRQLSAESELVAGWILLITSLPKEPWSDEVVLALYRARWQIELVFKRMKQILRLGLLRSRREVGSQATIVLWLIAWALQEQAMQPVRHVLEPVAQDLSEALTLSPSHQNAPWRAPVALSSWRLAALGGQSVRLWVQGHWTLARLLECWPLLQRFLRGSPRKRQQQEQAIRALLSIVMGDALSLDGLFFDCSSA